MSATTNNIFSRFIGGSILFFYERVFHEPAGEAEINFVQNLTYVGLGTILSTVFSFAYTIIGGRVLGPYGYGIFMLVQSISMFLYIPMLFGLNTAMIKYCAEGREQYEQRKIISTTYCATTFLIMVTVVIYIVFQQQIAAVFSVSQEVITLSILLAVLFVFYTLATSSLRGMHLMREYAVFQPFYGITLLSALLFLIYIQFNSSKAMIFATCLAYGVVGFIIVLKFLKNYLTFTIDRSWFSILWKYSSLAVIGGLSFTLYNNIDRIMINYYMGVESVGLYGVYYYAAFTVLTLFSGIFTTVFFSTASKSNDKSILYKKINKVIPYLLIIGIPLTLIGECIILLLFGEGYPIQLSMIVLFAVAALLSTVYGLYAWLFNSEGIRGSKLTVSGTLIIAIANIVLNVILIPYMGLYGAVVSIILAFTLGICYNLYRGRRFFIDKLES